MDLEMSKNLGGVGAILLVIGSLATFGTPYALVLDLIGIILVLVALNGLAGYYREDGIFYNAIYSIVVAIIGAVVLGGLVVFVVLNALTSIPGFPSNWQDPTAVSNFFTNFFSNPANYNTILEFAAQLVASWAIFIVFLTVAGYFAWRSLRTVASKSAVGLFGTAGLLIFIGAILTIVFIGLLLIWIGAILLAVAFFQMRPQAAQQAPPPPPSQ